MAQLGAVDRKGQVLVVVALGLVVLVAFVALAVDGGHLYAERRKMQNAADAGALAGARVLCFDSDWSQGTVEEAAEEYALDRNGAHEADVTITDNLTVTVIVTETTNTFFARVIGFPTVDVTALASAMCQGPSGVGNIWPLAVKQEVYTDPNHPDYIPCGALFYAFMDNDTITDDMCDIPATQLDEALHDSGCWPDNNPPSIATIEHLLESDRGWIDLYLPDPEKNPCKNESCGASMVDCWIQEAHPGPIAINDCVATERGTMGSLEKAVDTQICEVHNLLLFDGFCVEGGDYGAWYQCKDTQASEYYHVTGFGCMKVIGYYKADIPCKQKPEDVTYDRLVKNVKVIIVQKLCEGETEFPETCRSIFGDDEAPSGDEPRIIELTQ